MRLTDANRRIMSFIPLQQLQLRHNESDIESMTSYNKNILRGLEALAYGKHPPRQTRTPEHGAGRKILTTNPMPHR